LKISFIYNNYINHILLRSKSNYLF